MTHNCRWFIKVFFNRVNICSDFPALSPGKILCPKCRSDLLVVLSHILTGFYWTANVLLSSYALSTFLMLLQSPVKSAWKHPKTCYKQGPVIQMVFQPALPVQCLVSPRIPTFMSVLLCSRFCIVINFWEKSVVCCRYIWSTDYG